MNLAGPRLLVVVGKGGVGRSTVAAAVATLAAARGERVLLVDAVASGGAALALGPGATNGDGDGDGVTLLELRTEASLDEYVRLNLKVPIAPRSLGPIARIFDFVATAAPAVREILTIGKIGHEVRSGAWDRVVVDAPATGHAVELLASPDALGDLVGVGPLASETAWISELLADDEITAAVAVTLADELPVTETIELVGRLDAETSVTVAGVVVNRIPPPISDPGAAEAAKLQRKGGPVAQLAAIALDRHASAARERQRLEPLDLPMVDADDNPDDPLAAVTAALGPIIGGGDGRDDGGDS